MTTAHAPPRWCAIDFGTSNSGIARPDGAGGVHLVPLEPGQPTMPTAVFYSVEDLAPHQDAQRLYGRAAVAAYVEGTEGRLMRSMKSVLGSALADQRTDLGAGRSVRYLDVVADYLRELVRRAAFDDGAPLARAVLGRPVFFVDFDADRDAAAQAALAEAARRVGLQEVAFQYEPIAAAFDHEQRCTAEERVLVADIGGGTSDFSVVRVGPLRRERLDRRDDILASHGVHVAGTDFDRHLELRAILPHCGYRALGPATGGAPPREVPSRIYFDLATWHLINTCYAPQRVREVQAMRDFYAEARHHARLVRVLHERLGHDLAARAEAAKIDVAGGGDAAIALHALEPGLHGRLSAAEAREALAADVQRIVDAADETLRQAGLRADEVDTVYFTGGSTGLGTLVQALAGRCPHARAVHGDRYASVATGLGLHARRLWGTA